MPASFSSRLSRQPSVDATAAEKRKKILKRREEENALSAYRTGFTSSLIDKEQSNSARTRSIPPSSIGTPPRNGWLLESTPQSISPRTTAAPPRIVFGARSGSAAPPARSGRPHPNSRSGSALRASSAAASRRGRSVESRNGKNSRGGSQTRSGKRATSQQGSSDRLHFGPVLPTSARCVEICQGGLTLWCGDASGCLSVLDGRDATTLLIIDPPASGSFVETIHQIGNAMWVGYTDGRLRVHDAQVLSVLFEHIQPSKGAVTCFAPTDEGHVMYGSQDGTVTLLGGSAMGTSHHGERFAPCGSNSGSAFANIIFELRVSDVMVCTVETRGKRAFIGLDDGFIVCVSLIESGDVLYRTRAHSGRVNRVLVGANNLLFSCGEDSMVHAWECTSGSLVCHMKGHGTSVTDLFFDEGSSTLWTADESGIINVWAATAREKFKCLRSIENFVGTRVVSLKGLLLYTAATIWSIGNEHTNEVWKSTTNHLERTVDDALQGMHDIVKQDGVELVKWNDLLTALQNGEEEQCKAVADGLLNVVERRMLRGAFRKWSQFRGRRRSSWMKKKVDHALASHNSAIAAELERSQREESAWERRHFATRERVEEAEQHAQSLEAYRQNAAASRVLSEQTQSRYASLVAQRMEANAQNCLLTSSYLRWERFASQRAHNNRRRKWAEVFEDSVLKSKVREYWWRWMNALESTKSIATIRNNSLSLIGLQRERLLLSTYYYRWQRCVSTGIRQRRQEQKCIVWLSSSSNAQILRRYFTAWSWHAHHSHRGETATDRVLSKSTELQSCDDGEKEKEEDEEEDRSLADQIAAASLAVKQEVCDVCDSSIAAVLEELSRRRIEISDAKGAIDVARGFMTDAGEGSVPYMEQDESDDVSSARLCVRALLGKLEATCINVFDDAEILSEIADSLDAAGAAHTFATACKSLQARIAEISDTTAHESMVADRWSATADQIHHMSRSQQHHVLKAIKTLIVSFNLLSPEQLDIVSVEEDALAINAELIRRLVGHCSAALRQEGVEEEGNIGRKSPARSHSNNNNNNNNSNRSNSGSSNSDESGDESDVKQKGSNVAANPTNAPANANTKSNTNTNTNAQTKRNKKNSKSRNRRSSRRKRR